MIKIKLFKSLLVGLILTITSNSAYSQISYEEYQARYKPTNKILLPDEYVVKTVNEMETTKAAGQVTVSTNDSYNGDDDAWTLVANVLTSCKREKVAAILAEMDPEDAVKTLKLVKDEWIRELVYFLDMQTYHEIAPALLTQLELPEDNKNKSYKDFNTEVNENVDKHLNTSYTEVTPRISADGKTLYVVRENHPLNTTGAAGSQDIWVGDVTNGLDNATATHLEKPFNQNSYNSVIGVSPDGTSMMIKGRYNSAGEYLGIGFSMLQKTNSGWSPPKALDVKDYTDMANGDYVGAHWSTDGKTLVLSFSEDADDNNQDVYSSHLQSDGSWSKPKSMGNSINTDGDESGPFLASDGKTLYFSSNRDGGQGSNDIWLSQRQDDTWTNWSTPVNLGDEVNSSKWESYYTIDAQGKYAYMVTYENSKGGADIVRIELKEEMQPDPVVLVRGVVLDQKTNKPVSARIIYNGIDDGKNYGGANSDPKTGAYTIILPYGVNYEFTASANNYIGVSDNLDLTKVGEYKEIEKDLLLVPIEVGATVRLNNIFFETGKSELKSSSYAELNRIAKFLKDNPNVTIEVSGHTDNVGSVSANESLSLKRASAVTEYLLAQGIDKSRLVAKGYGMKKPIADNKTDEGKTLNRRVEFIILSNN